MLPSVVTCIRRMYEDWQREPRPGEQSPYSRLLSARDTAFAMILALSQIPVHQKNFDTDSSVSIIRDCIIPRIQKMLKSAERDRHLGPRRYFSYSSNSRSEGRFESQIAHIELMIHLVENRESFGPKFWSSIARWQLEAYRRFCEKLLREYREATCDMSDDREGVDAFIGALEKVVKRAHALPEPDPKRARISDVFSIRNAYEDPDVKVLIDSNRFTSRKRLELQNTVEDLLLQQPIFPPECYALQRI